jgi:hypothetical protein
MANDKMFIFGTENNQKAGSAEAALKWSSKTSWE